MAGIVYRVGERLGAEAVAEIFGASGLDQRRPADPQRLARMFEGSNLVVTAREDGQLVGVARALTDFSYVCYLSDLAVARSHQGRGIGAELVRRTHEAAGGTKDVALLLLAAPAAMDFYPKIGMSRADNCWRIARTG